MSDYYKELDWIDRQDGHDTVLSDDVNIIAHEAQKLGKEKLNKSGEGKDLTVTFEEVNQDYPNIYSGDKLSLIISKIKKFILDLKRIKADTDNPTFTGVPKAPTADSNSNSSQIATTAFVKNNIINNLQEASGIKALSDAMGKKLDDEKAPKNSPTFTGKVTLPIDTRIGDVTKEEIAYLKGLNGGIQAQLDNIPKYKYLDGIMITISDSSTQEQINTLAITKLKSTYPSPVIWNAVSVEVIFRPSDLRKDAEFYFNGVEWIFLHYISTAINRANGSIAGIVEDSEDLTFNDGQASITNTGLAKKAPAFTEASVRNNLNSGENFATILGKIKKVISDLKTVAFTGSHANLSNIGTNTHEQIDTALEQLSKTKEPVFTKNTGFNKNFGTVAGTVAEGNHKHSKSEITDFPTSLPANGGNADSVGGVKLWQIVRKDTINIIDVDPNSTGEILRLRDKKADGNNDSFGGLYLGSAQGIDFILGKHSNKKYITLEMRTHTGSIFFIYDPQNNTFEFKGDIIENGNRLQDKYVMLSEKGVANGVASLGGDGKIPSSQLPNYVDFANKSEAETGTENTKAMTPLRVFEAIAKWVTTIEIGILSIANSEITSSDNIRSALGKLQGQIKSKLSAVLNNPTNGQILSYDGTKWINKNPETFSQQQVNWNENNQSSVQYIQNKPSSLPADGGNADTATKLKTARKINGQPFDGSSDITIEAGGNKYTTTFTTSNWTGTGTFNFTIEAATHKCGTDIDVSIYVLEGSNYIKTVGYPSTGYKVSVDSVGNVTITTTVKFAGKVIIS